MVVVYFMQEQLYKLFKPYELHFIGLQDMLDATGLSLKEWLKIDMQCECSKSINESCMNCECQYNMIKLHDDKLYVENFKEIQDERKQVEDKLKEDFKKYYGKEYVP